MRRWIPIAILVTAAAGSLGHGGGGCCGGGDDDDDGAQFICDGTEHALTAGTTASGATYTLTIVSATPAEHSVQGIDDAGTPTLLNELVVTLTDGAAAPVEGASFPLIVPFAAKHDHGTPIDPEVAELGGGDYEITSLNYIHRGPWRVDIDLDAGGTADSLQFVFCIRDADYEDAGVGP